MMSSLTSTNKSLNRSRSINNNALLRGNNSINNYEYQNNNLEIKNNDINHSKQEIFINNKYFESGEDQKICLNELLRKLQLAKEERKLAEKNSKILEHRVVLLMNQEKLVII